MRATSVLLRRLPRHLAHLSSSMDVRDGPRGVHRAWSDLRGASSKHRAAIAAASWRTRDEVVATSSPEDRDGDGVMSFALEADARDAAAELDAEMIDAVVPSGQPAAAVAAARSFLHDLDAEDAEDDKAIETAQGGAAFVDNARELGRRAIGDFYAAQGLISEGDAERFAQVMCEPAATLFAVNDTLAVARLTTRAQLRALAASARPNGVEYYDCVPGASGGTNAVADGAVPPALVTWTDDAGAPHAAVVEEWFFRAVRDGTLLETDLVSVATAALVRAAVAEAGGAGGAPVLVDVCSSQAAQPPAGRDVLIDLCRGGALPRGAVAVCVARPGDADEAATELSSAATAIGVEAALLEGPARRRCPALVASADIALVLPPSGGDGWRTFDGRHGAFGGVPIDRFPEIVRKAVPTFEADVAALQRAMAYTRPGGRVIYAVCSMSPLEGEAVIAAALASPEGAAFAVDAALPDTHLRSSGLLGVQWRGGLAHWLAPPDAPRSMHAESHTDTLREAISRGALRTHPLYDRCDGIFVCVLRRAVTPLPQPSALPLTVEGLIERTTALGTRPRRNSEFVATPLAGAAPGDAVSIDVDPGTFVRILWAGRLRADSADIVDAAKLPDVASSPLFVPAASHGVEPSTLRLAFQQAGKRGVPISIGLSPQAVSKELLGDLSVLAGDLAALRLVLAPDSEGLPCAAANYMPIDEPAWRAARAAFAYLLH